MIQCIPQVWQSMAWKCHRIPYLVTMGRKSVKHDVASSNYIPKINLRNITNKNYFFWNQSISVRCPSWSHGRFSTCVLSWQQTLQSPSASLRYIHTFWNLLSQKLWLEMFQNFCLKHFDKKTTVNLEHCSKKNRSSTTYPVINAPKNLPKPFFRWCPFQKDQRPHHQHLRWDVIDMIVA